MLKVENFDQIYFYGPFIDFRKGIYGLADLVQHEMNIDLFQKYLFIFTNKGRSKLKALYWDHSGFALWVKYLIEDKFKWPLHYESDVISVDVKKLNDFLIGLDPFQLPFSEKKFEKV